MKSNIKTILLTGASGFLGRTVYSRLQKEGYSVIPLVEKPAGLAGEIIIDLGDPEFISKLPPLSRLDAVIHTAARIDFSSRQDPAFFEINTLATHRLAKFSQEKKAHFIFTSSIAVFGNQARNIDEKTIINPESSYGLSKWLAEELIKNDCVSFSILRFPGIFGRNGGGHLGLNKAIGEALAGRAPKLAGPGSGRRNYIFVEDAAEVIFFSLKNKLQGTYFCGGTDKLPIRKILEKLCDAFLPGKKIIEENGPDSFDQIVGLSSPLPAARTFQEAFDFIKNKSV
ncbi:MAG: NAD(P)-dependent oxidoreductase [Patescibacteria group bacterium]